MSDALGVDPNWKPQKNADKPDPLAALNPRRLQRKAGKIGGKLDTTVGGALTYGHDHPFDAFMNVLGTPQRALEALETGNDIGRAITHPGDQRRLSRAVKEKIGLQGLEDNQLAGNDLLHKLARGTLDTTLDVVNDPMTVAPVGKGFELAGKLLPRAAKAVEWAADAARATPLGKLLDPEAPLAALTDHGKALYEAAQNRAQQAVHHLAQAEEAVVRQAAQDIRNGIIPQRVQALFRDPKNIPVAKKGLHPQEVVSALHRDRAPVLAQMVKQNLAHENLIHGHGNTLGLLKNPLASVFNNPAEADAVKDALEKVAGTVHTTDNDLLKLFQRATHLGNKAFLALPFPHGLNLANLAYNRYGVPTLIKGLANSARVATGTVGKGKLARNIAELEKAGAHSQFGNIFDELGITRVAGIPGTEGAANLLNKAAIIPAERASNFLQNTFLNPLETGLRSAALDAERKAGKTGEDAARQIHKAFGSDAPSRLTRAASDIGTPFSKFHGQTSVGSGLRTLATNPGRVATIIKGDRDYNNQVNPGASAKFHLAIPTMNTARAVTDPLHYFATLLGPIGAAGQGYSSLSQAEKGHVASALGAILERYVALSEAGEIVTNILAKKRGRAGEKATSDLPTLLTGGNYQKPKL